MSILKDLLYTKDNAALDISRLSSALAVLTYLGLAISNACKAGAVDLANFGTGWGLVAAGCAAWIFARQSKEGK